MKQRTRVLGIFLAVVMVIGLIPLTASADNGESDKYIVHCVLSTGLPARNAEIVLTSKYVENCVETYTADYNGIVEIPKTLSGIYGISASCAGSVQGIEWQCTPDMNWNINTAGDDICLKFFPVLAVELEYNDHDAYMVGYSDGSFGPNNTITRAEVASLLYRLMTEETRDLYYSTENTFADVQESMAHNTAISTLVNAGVIDGITGTTFGYKDIITREQFAAMLGRLFSINYIGRDIFTDTSDSYARSYFNLLGRLGILLGDGSGCVHPSEQLTRSQVCAMLNRLLGRSSCAESTAKLSDISNLKTFSDIDPHMALYADIIEATNSHRYEFCVSGDGNVTESWTMLDPTISWIAVQNK